MSDPAADPSRAQTEAAGWFARMSRREVSSEDLHRFRRWKRDPAHAAAYAQVQATWAGAGDLGLDPDLRAATAATLAKHSPRPTPAPARLTPRVLLGGAALAAAGAIAAGLAFEQRDTYSTHVGEQRLIVLADGSRVRLNTDSRLKVRYRPDERRVVLTRGEAFFEAAHDASRPFLVEADGARVRALGTRFDVRRDPTDVQVTLLEGRVRVARADQAQAATLAPNQQLTVSGAGLSPIRAADPAEAAGWTSGRLTFHGAPLAAAVREVNRYALRKVALDGPPALGRRPISGAFNTGDTEAFAAAMQELFDLQRTTAPNGDIRLAPRAAAPAAWNIFPRGA